MCLQPDLHEALFYSSQLVAGAKTEGTTNCVWNHLLTQAIKHLHTQNQVQVANCTRKQVIAGAISCKCNFSPETNCSQSKETGIRNSAPNVCVVIATTCDFNRLSPSRLQVQWPRFGLYEQLDCLLLLCVALWQSLLQFGLVFLEQTSFFRTLFLSFLQETLTIWARVHVLLNCT